MEIRIGRGCVVLGLAAGLLLTASSASAAPLAQSKFNDNVEGWKVVGDTAGDPEKPNYVEEGGSNGAFAQVVDKAVGGVMYWRAPAKFRGNKAKAYKGTLEFSLTQSLADSQFEADDIVLEGSGLRLVSDVVDSPPVFPEWMGYVVTFTKENYTDVTDEGSPSPATGKDMKDVLGDLDNLFIRAEYRTGDDTDGLDTVKMKAG